MRITLLYGSLLACGLAVGLAACERDELVTTTDTTVTLPGDRALVTADFYGRLVDDAGRPVSGALVRAGASTTTTDPEGHWSIAGARVGVDFGYVTFASPAHHRGSRTVFAREGGRYRIDDVELLPLGGGEAIDAASGGAVTLPDGASVRFGGGAFAKTDGTPLASGSVRVHARYLDAAAEATYRRMPGDLRAVREGASPAPGEETLLTTYGMLAVELRDDAGREVQLAEGQRAELRFPLASEALAEAPATIPLWYFDEASGLWIEEGQAELVDGAYVGEVAHFTFWNCDIPTDWVRLCGEVCLAGIDTTIFPGDSTDLLPLVLTVRSARWGTRRGYLDADGRFCGVVPANETLTFSVLDDRAAGCDDAVYTATIGPFSEDADLGKVDVDLAEAHPILVWGSAACDGVPVLHGAAQLFAGGEPVASAPIDSGTVRLSALLCDTSGGLTVVVRDYGSLAESEPLSVAYAPSVSIGVVDACVQALTEYFSITIDGDETVYPICTARYFGGEGWGVEANAGQPSQREYATVQLSDLSRSAAPGTYTLSFNDYIGFSSPTSGFSNVNLTGETATLTRNDETTGGIFAGRIEPFQVPLDSAGQLVTVTAEFSARIDN